MFVSACAKIEAPSGGPLDKDPPFLIRTFPDSGAVGVEPVDSLVIVFSEKMDHNSAELALRISPPVEFRAREWEGHTWRLLLRERFAPNTTYSVLLGAEARDLRKNLVGVTRSFAFSTGESLDIGTIEGQVTGQRFSAKKQWVYAWPWNTAPPDTMVEGPPPPSFRMGQTDDKGAFVIPYAPLHEPLRVCVFYDRDGDGSFQPLPDRWACFEDSVVIADSARVTGVELFVAASDEPALVKGAVIDSSCATTEHRDLFRRSQAERDSILEWLEGELQSRRRGQGRLTMQDSVRIEAQLGEIASLEAAAKGESLLCAQPIIVRLTSDTTTVREAREAEFEWGDVPSGIYRLNAFRDVNANGSPDAGEARGAYPYAIETAPLRTLEGLDILIEVPEGEEPLQPTSSSEPISGPRPLDSGGNDLGSQIPGARADRVELSTARHAKQSRTSDEDLEGTESHASVRSLARAATADERQWFSTLLADASKSAVQKTPQGASFPYPDTVQKDRGVSEKGVRRCTWSPTSNGPELHAASGWLIGGRCV